MRFPRDAFLLFEKAVFQFGIKHQLRSVDTIGSYYRFFCSSLVNYEKEEAGIVASLVFEHELGLNRIDLTLRSDDGIDHAKRMRLDTLLEALKRNVPVQYVLGETWFYGMRLEVNSHVLIPRRETEELVETIVRKTKSDPKIIIDFCTGSGCIALAMKKSFPGTEVIGIDVSEEALNVARRNAVSNSLQVSFEKINILKNFPDVKAGIVVSNPPYVLFSERSAMDPRVTEFEPDIALFVQNDNPLIFYRRISELSMVHSPGAEIYYEINEMMGKEISELHSQLGFTNYEILKDLQGKDRFFRGRIPQ
jgi:release factor glutamine methyltransferase